MDPLDVLESSVDDSVTVRLKDGSTYRGVLAGYDQHMNVVLDPSTGADGESGVEDTTIIRGDNVVTIE
jgi:small nuclear ribonucleoprotein